MSRAEPNRSGLPVDLSRMAGDDFVTLVDAAAIIGVTPNTLRAQWKKGRIGTEKRGRDRWIPLAELGRYQREVQRRPKSPLKSKRPDRDPIQDAEELARLFVVALQAPNQNAGAIGATHAAIGRLTAALPDARRRRVTRLLEAGVQVVLADDGKVTHAEAIAKARSATLVATVCWALARERAGHS